MTMALKGLGKLVEEMGELLQVLGKKIAYYHTDEHPDGAGSLKTRMEDEWADVRAAGKFLAQKWLLDENRIKTREENKLNRFNAWDLDLENNEYGADAPNPYSKASRKQQTNSVSVDAGALNMALSILRRNAERFNVPTMREAADEVQKTITRN